MKETKRGGGELYFRLSEFFGPSNFGYGEHRSSFPCKKVSLKDLSSLLLLVDAFGLDIAALHSGDESVTINKTLDHGVFLFVSRIDL